MASSRALAPLRSLAPRCGLSGSLAPARRGIATSRLATGSGSRTAAAVAGALAGGALLYGAGRFALSDPVEAEAVKGSKPLIAPTSKPSGSDDYKMSFEPPSPLYPDDPSLSMRARATNHAYSLQHEIVTCLERLEPRARFLRDAWTRPQGGGGVSCVLQGGDVFEKAGVLVSAVEGDLPEAAERQMRARGKNFGKPGEKLRFFAAGCSMVIHPHNPHAPTTHLNYRYFEVVDSAGAVVSAWFGGGADLTPSYLYPGDAEHFHRLHKEACDRHDPAYYPKFKKWADEYFWSAHRGEARGVGGIFFDDLDDRPADQLLAFSRDCARQFVRSYVPIMEKRKDMPFTEEEKRWQQIRRGRYVEFNLIHDRGTKFGLATPGARIESILASMPLTSRWEYMFKTKPGTREWEMEQVLQKPREWV